jgi:hypothetical protein
MSLQEKCDELARASKEKGDSASGAGVSARGSSILLNQISASSGGFIAYGDESDTTIPKLNTVSIYIHGYSCLHLQNATIVYALMTYGKSSVFL